MKKLIILALCLMVYSTALSFEEKGKDGSKGGSAEHGHWYSGEVIKKLNYDSLWDGAANINESSEGNKVIEKCLEAYGGLEHLKTLNNLAIEYKSQSLFSEANSHKVEIFYNKDLKYKKISTVNDSLNISVTLNGDKAIKVINDQSSLIDKRDYKAELFSNLVISMPAGIKTTNFSEVKYGKRVDDPLEYIYLKKEDSLIMVIAIDPTDNYIKKIEGVIIEGTSYSVFINYFSDFKEYDGFILPSTKMNVSMGLRMSEYSINSAKINQELDGNLFKIDDNKEL